ncbi:MAG: FAD:protein FMN transferase, partial [bacterium]
QLSKGKFDITSGVLRRAWQFKGQPVKPDEKLIAELLELVGWEKVELEDKSIRLRPGMEIDLGGVGKEYAVDRVADQVHALTKQPLLVNFGGDIRAIGRNPEGGPWKIGIEKPTKLGSALGVVELVDGAVATSGDAQRFCYVNGKRLGHILDPLTGWPVRDAPRSVTVVAANCLEAGLLATLAMLQGANAESFLEEVGVKHHCVR